jgi:lysophospholipase L1-like esterase
MLRFCFYAAWLLAVAGSVSLGQAAEPQWIWGTPNAQTEAPSGACYFRKVIKVEKPHAAEIAIACDNTYALLINNRRVAAGKVWQQMDRYEISEFLAPGENVIELHCTNEGNSPAGLVARLRVTSQGEAPVEYVTDASWRAKVPPSGTWKPGTIDDRPWTKVHVLGPLGKTAPWGDSVAVTEIKKLTHKQAQPWNGPFELRDGDRVVLIGNTLIERAQLYGYWETALTRAYPDRGIIFRNLGWSGDTVFGHARARFGSVSDGFAHLEKHVREAEPTVIILGYGSNAAHHGEAGLPEFLQGLDHLLAVCESTGARIALLSPLKYERLPPPLPDPAEYNQNARLYADALREVAAKRGYKFVDLYDLLGDGKSLAASGAPAPVDRLTDNGVHLNAYGYWRAAEALADGLAFEPPAWRVTLRADEMLLNAVGVTVSDVETTPRGVRFTALARHLPAPPPPEFAPRAAVTRREMPVLAVPGLKPGRYELAIDGQVVATADAVQWAAGVPILRGPQFEQAERLRAAIERKNQLFFYRWRPQNETYLYLFRKHEQGQNAREIPLFDPLVAEAEQQINQLKKPTPHRFELSRV